MCHKYKKTRNENFTFFFGLKYEQFTTLTDVVHIKEWYYVHVKAACTLIKLGSGSGSCSSHSSLLPLRHNQCTTHKCLPVSPAAPPIFLTWPKHGVTGVMVLIVQAGCHYYTFQNCSVISLHFLRDIVGGSLLLYIPKHQFTSTIFLRNDHSMNIMGWDEEF
jgi:hypothetical protein